MLSQCPEVPRQKDSMSGLVCGGPCQNEDWFSKGDVTLDLHEIRVLL